MEWMESLRTAIDYIEDHLLEEISIEGIADTVYISSFYFQKGFKIMTGYSISEYIRYRRLYMAALEVIKGEEKVIDLAYKYGYDTPESFTKAFSRFHGLSPMQLRGDVSKIKIFLPLKIKITVQGGNEMDYVVEDMEKFQMIGYERVFSQDSSYGEIPKFWGEFCERCMKGENSREVQEVIEKCVIGEYGICIDDIKDGKNFHYMIAGKYDGGPVPEGMVLIEIPALKWAKFKCTGPMPGALQTINTKIFKEWLPGNPNYKISKDINIEWYALGDTQAFDYESGIWIPVEEK